MSKFDLNKCINSVKLRQHPDLTPKKDQQQQQQPWKNPEVFERFGFIPHKASTNNFKELVYSYFTNYSNNFYPNLKWIVCSQWALESGWGHSALAVKHNNYAGLKWRDEMVNYATAVIYTSPSDREKTFYCKFSNPAHFILGYWKFMSRPVYAGLEEFRDNPEKYLEFIYKRGYAGDPKYVEKVLDIYVRHTNYKSFS